MNKQIFEEGENIFLPINKESDEKCYRLNNINNWAESFYNLKSGVILQRYRQIMSKTEYHQFFEALNYEYGINNFPCDVIKAFKIYKTAAETSTDTLSMYRLYRIYKKDFKKFNIKKRNNVLEKFYIMKCYTYLTTREKSEHFLLAGRFNIYLELGLNIFSEEKSEYFSWFSKYFEFLYDNYEIYNLKKDDILLVEAIMDYRAFWRDNICFLPNLYKLEEKGNPEAIYNLCIFNKGQEKSYYIKRWDKLYKMNYYRSFDGYANALDYSKESLVIIKKSLLKGYYYHIKKYKEIFFMIYNFESIFKTPKLRAELMFIFGCLIDAIIADELEFFLEFILMRKITIKHFNFEIEFKKNFDFYTKELLIYLLKFKKSSNEKNKEMLIKYYINNDFYLELYTKLAYVFYFGVSGIMERNFDEAINIGTYLLKAKDILYDERFIYFLIYLAKSKKRKLNKMKYKKGIIKKNINDKKEEENFLKLEKMLMEMHYKFFNEEEIKKFPPSIFYNLSKFYRPYATNNDPILEYVLLNRASNSTLVKLEKYTYDYFQENYLLYKSKKKLKEKNKSEKFKKLFDTKGVINIEGYGEDGTICPICLDKKKTVICLPCRHSFCLPCINKLIEKASCPICRAQIRITFDLYTKTEKFIQPVVNKKESSSVENLSFSLSWESDDESYESENNSNNNRNNNRNNNNNNVFNFSNLSFGSND